MIPLLEITFLGTGPSVGVPVMTCDCPVCLSNHPRNQRLRASIFLETPTTRLLVDAGPDLRNQALKFQLKQVDAVLFTHGHVDHVAGFDDLRAFCWKRKLPLPMYVNSGTEEILQRMFGWAFEHNFRGYVRPDTRRYTPRQQVGDFEVEPIEVMHGSVETHGLLFRHAQIPKGFAYLPDVKSIPDASLEKLCGLDTLVIDTLRNLEHSSHLSLPESLAIIDQLKPRKAYLTHLSHDFDYDELSSRLPDSIEVAYDGLKITYP